MFSSERLVRGWVYVNFAICTFQSSYPIVVSFLVFELLVIPLWFPKGSGVSLRKSSVVHAHS